jgi:hypothetical protein
MKLQGNPEDSTNVLRILRCAISAECSWYSINQNSYRRYHVCIVCPPSGGLPLRSSTLGSHTSDARCPCRIWASRVVGIACCTLRGYVTRQSRG